MASSRPIRTLALVAALAVTTSGSLARPMSASAAVATTRLTDVQAAAVTGEGWLTCAGAVAAGIASAGTLIGATIGAIAVVCGCAEYLDSALGTNYEDAC